MATKAWSKIYSVFRSTADGVQGSAVTGALTADWTMISGQTPRDVAIPIGGVLVDADCAYEPGTALVAPYFRYDPSAGVRDVFFRASAALRPGAVTGPSSTLTVFKGTSAYANFRIEPDNASYPGSPGYMRMAVSGAGNQILYNSPAGNTWHRVGIERTADGVYGYHHPTTSNNHTSLGPDEEMLLLFFIPASALREGSWGGVGATLYVGGQLSGAYSVVAGTGYYSGLAQPYLAETQLLSSGSTSITIPTAPLSDIAVTGGDLLDLGAGATSSTAAALRRDLQRSADYHRYKSIRSIANTLAHLRLDR